MVRRAVAVVVEIAVVCTLLYGGYRVRMRLCENWHFAGSDTYGYLKLAKQMRQNHRYALDPPPAELQWVRPPLYPILLLAVRWNADLDKKGDPEWQPIQHAQIAFDLLITSLLVYFVARRMAGPVGGALALALAMVCPFTVLSTGAALTECLATCLSVLAIAPLTLGQRRPRIGFPLAAAMVALSVLVRPDGLLLGAAFVPAILLLRPPRAVWRQRLIVAALCAGSFLVVLAPWPIRNQIQFGAPHPIGGRIDRYSRPVIHYQGFWAWLRAWAPDWKPMTWPTTCFYDVGCHPTVALYEGPGAFDSKEERAVVEQLLKLRIKQGHTQAVSDGFQRLADEKIARHRLAYHLTLPLSRAFGMWVAPFDELLQGPPPWPEMTTLLRPHLEEGSKVLLLAMLAGGAILLLRRSTRGDAAVLVTTIGVRTAVMAYTFYCMPRYALEVMPLGYALIGAGAVEGVRALGSLGWFVARSALRARARRRGAL
ncbi:MAG: hypothetical protein EXR72_05815 [Myxococcales bacterium]|nr:hypothetical protein [Myxococcales bacterium]